MIESFKNAKLLIIGDLMLDKYYYGSTSRISPEAPVPVVKINKTEDRVGGAANVALNAASLGIKVNLISITGNDDEHNKVIKILKNKNVNCLFQQESNIKTNSKLRILSQHQQLIRLDFEDSFADIKLNEDLYTKKIKFAPVVVLSDYGKGVLSNISNIIDLANKNNIKTIIDPKGNDFNKYANAFMLTPNLKEFEAIVGKCNSDIDIVEKGFKLINKYNFKALLITRGENGMTLLQKQGNKTIHLSTSAREVYDVTGAGDTVISLLASAISAGNSIEDATKIANVAAGIVVAKLGTAAVSIDELKVAFNEIDYEKQKILSLAILKERLSELKNSNKKIVFTNGCFDILHPGHIHYLQKAKQFGDILIVAVNDDNSVKRLKGNKRPINNLNYRLKVLAGLESIDYLVSFNTDTPESLICDLLPNVLVKGADYKKEDIVGYKCVTANGGKVEVIDFLKDYSSTKTIEKIS